MILFGVAVALWLFMLLLPFLAGGWELYRSRDAAPLLINQDYIRDPRYFALAFKKILFASFPSELVDENGEPLPPLGIFRFKLSKEETIIVVADLKLPTDTEVKTIHCVLGDFSTNRRVVCHKEVYVKGSVFIGEGSRLRALACDGDVQLAFGTEISRWLDAAKSLQVASNCRLGINVTCSGKLVVAPNCSFKRLYGFPISVGRVLGAAPEARKEELAAGYLSSTRVRNLWSISCGTKQDSDIITKSSLELGDHVVVRGHIKAHGRVSIGRQAVITGNLFAEGDIFLGEGSHVLGTIFSQGIIVLESGTVVGFPGEIKSVVGRKGVQLHQGARVYGYVMTEGQGKTV